MSRKERQRRRRLRSSGNKLISSGVGYPLIKEDSDNGCIGSCFIFSNGDKVTFSNGDKFTFSN